MNLKTGKIEAEFHKYVMPIESPKLSSFCTELTGITQNKVDTGIPLQTALMVFQEWVRKELRSRNLYLPKMNKDKQSGNVAFVTWSDWDFETKEPPFFNQWIDLKAIFKEYYHHKPINFNDALLHVGLQFAGREHSGIDDSKNLASLVYKMVKDGATLVITKDLTPFQLTINFSL
uniref:Exonuclease domain-containing protein n=1 Tax=Megaselia scalaris TaxID=36166 RepID=T1H243_MEGSC